MPYAMGHLGLGARLAQDQGSQTLGCQSHPPRGDRARLVRPLVLVSRVSEVRSPRVGAVSDEPFASCYIPRATRAPSTEGRWSEPAFV